MDSIKHWLISDPDIRVVSKGRNQKARSKLCWDKSIWLFFIILAVFLFFFLRSNPSFISYSILLLEYSTVPFFSPFIILSTFIVLIFPVFLFQFIMSSSSLPLSPPIITFLSFGLLILFSFSPFLYYYILLSTIIILWSLVVDIAVVIRGIACFGVIFVLFCFVLPAPT